MITHLVWHIYQLRSDLQLLFPDPLAENRWAFVEWFMQSAQQDHRLDYDIFMKPMAEALATAHQERLASCQLALQEREAELSAIYGSRTWQIARKMQQAYQRLKQPFIKLIKP